MLNRKKSFQIDSTDTVLGLYREEKRFHQYRSTLYDVSCRISTCFGTSQTLFKSFHTSSMNHDYSTAADSCNISDHIHSAFFTLVLETSASPMWAEKWITTTYTYGDLKSPWNLYYVWEWRKVTVSKAFSVNYFIGPYYFDNLIIKRESYLRLWCHHFLRALPIFSENTIFSEDRVLEHYSNQTIQLLNISLSGTWIGRVSLIAWPPRSLDLTTLPIFMCRFLKDNAFQNPCPPLMQLKRRKTSAISSSNTNTLQDIWNSAL